MNRKKSKVWRKDLNQLRALADVPWPARRFRYPATVGRPLLTDRRCSSVIDKKQRRRRGWRGVVDFVRRRKPVTDIAICNQPLQLVPATAARNGHLICPRCTPIRRAFRKAAHSGELRRAIALVERSGRRR